MVMDGLLQHLLLHVGWLLSAVKLGYGDTVVNAEVWASSQTWHYQKLPTLSPLHTSPWRPGGPWISSWATQAQPGVTAWPLQGPVPWGGSGQDWSQPTRGPVGAEKDVYMEVDLDLQGAIEDILHKDLLIWAWKEAWHEQGLLLLPPQSHPGGNAHLDLSCHLLWVCRRMVAISLGGGKRTPRSAPSLAV